MHTYIQVLTRVAHDCKCNAALLEMHMYTYMHTYVYTHTSVCIRIYIHTGLDTGGTRLQLQRGAA